jgi:hypothetical protein
MLIVAIKLVVGVGFLLAGTLTLARFSKSRRDMECFGAPVRLAAPLAVLLGLVELCVAVALLPMPGDWEPVARPLGIFGVVVGGVIAGAFFVSGFRAGGEPAVAPPRTGSSAVLQPPRRPRKVA